MIKMLLYTNTYNATVFRGPFAPKLMQENHYIDVPENIFNNLFIQGETIEWFKDINDEDLDLPPWPLEMK